MENLGSDSRRVKEEMLKEQVRQDIRRVKEEDLREKVKKSTSQISIEDLRNRFEWHPPKDELTGKKHGKVRNACLDLAITLSELIPDGREKSFAITHLEEVMMWANAGIARAD